MPAYIRFLQAPHTQPNAPRTIRTVLTLTSDLAVPVSAAHALTVTVYDFGDAPTSVLRCASHSYDWRPGMVALRVEETLGWEVGEDAEVVVSLRRDERMGEGDDAEMEGLDVIQGHRFYLGGWRGDDWRGLGGVVGAKMSFNREDNMHFTRLFDLGEGREIEVAERIGESICGHIWDGGLYLTHHIAALLNKEAYAQQHGDAQPTPKHSYNILELGSGTGIVGTTLSTLLPSSRVILSDLESADETLAYTIELNELRGNEVDMDDDMDEDDEDDDEPKLQNFPLEWTSDKSKIPKWAVGTKWDIILISDCTYNPDSYDILLDTLKALVKASQLALVIYASKRRHSSEVEFEQRLEHAASGFRVLKQWNQTIPGANGEGETIEYRGLISTSALPLPASWAAEMQKFKTFWSTEQDGLF